MHENLQSKHDSTRTHSSASTNAAAAETLNFSGVRGRKDGVAGCRCGRAAGKED
ncbi:hypothetical protein WN51_05643 [Melipona quadrifasciata]|uniref:Uncharacterized protein n=1 Tax=Melipona quadrifasciata TaxID=166423 RepID=A0A0M8ZSR6_9HYME|nr:hypothetical protein WN51_05643 [Melipona quadrifasciata]